MTQQLIPEGRWRAHAMNAELGYTQSGNEQVIVNLAFSGGQDPEVDNRMITWWGSFSDKAKPHTLKALLTLGWDGQDLAELTGVQQHEVELVVQHEADQRGQMRHRVRFINAIGSGGATVRNPMSDEQKRAFAAKMRGEVLALQQAAAAPQPTAAPKPAPRPAPRTPAPKDPANAIVPPDEDNVPF